CVHDAVVFDLIDVEKHARVDHLGGKAIALLVFEPLTDVVDARSRDLIAASRLSARLVRREVHAGNEESSNRQSQRAVAAVELIAHLGADDPGGSAAEPLLQRSKHFGRLDDMRISGDAQFAWCGHTPFRTTRGGPCRVSTAGDSGSSL